MKSIQEVQKGEHANQVADLRTKFYKNFSAGKKTALITVTIFLSLFSPMADSYFTTSGGLDVEYLFGALIGTSLAIYFWGFALVGVYWFLNWFIFSVIKKRPRTTRRNFIDSALIVSLVLALLFALPVG